MPDLPLQGNPGVWDQKNPTLLPNFDIPRANGSTVDLMSPRALATSDARTDATTGVTIGGSVTNGDTATLTVTAGTLPSGAKSWTYDIVTADSVDTVAEGLVALINADADAQAVGLSAKLGGTGEEAEIILHWGGPIGNFAVLTVSKSAGATITLTRAPTSGAFSGGAGPVIAANNFTWSAGGVTSSFWYGKPVDVGYDQLTEMVAQGMPVF